MLVANQAATVAELIATPIKNTAPEPTVIEAVAPAQVPEIATASAVPASLATAVATPKTQTNAEPAISRHHVSNKTAYEDAAAELNDALNKLYDLPFLSRDEVQNKID